MGDFKHDGLAVPGKVDLAHEPPFVLGNLHVDPPTRQLVAGDRQETVEPKVMQVLVALFRAAGTVVSRDELIDRCWDGRIVGDDALNRVIGRIRTIASGVGAKSFRVDTISRVGYRLNIAGKAPGITQSPAKPSFLPRVDRRTAIVGLVATGSILALGSAAYLATRGPAVPPEAKALFDEANALTTNGDLADDWQIIAYLKEAVRLAPDYGQAWGKLALMYRSMLLQHPVESTAGFDVLLADAVRQARRFDPDNPDALAAELVSQNPFGQWARFEQVFARLLQNSPGYPLALRQQGILLMNVGRWRDARTTLATLKARRPLDPVLRYQLIVSTWSAGELSAAENELEEATRRWPRQSVIWETKVKILALSGRPKAALTLASDPDSQPLDNLGGVVALRTLWLKALASGSRADISRAIDANTASARAVENQALPSAMTIASLGEAELALDILEGFFLKRGAFSEVYPRPTRGGPQFTTHPLFQPHAAVLWKNPRFGALLDEIGLERYWRSTGTLPDFRQA